MGQKIHRFKVAEARRIHHPVHKKIEKHFFSIRAKDIPPDIITDANAREPVGTNRRVYKEVKDSLLGLTSTPGTFDLMNKGITILADEVRRIADDVYDIVVSPGKGIVDGGHTYQIILESKDSPELSDDQFVEVQVRTGVEERLITDIARGLNTGIQVKQHSLDNLDGAYDWIRDEVEDEQYAPLISWRESDDGEYDVRDLLSVLEALNVIDFPNEGSSHPIHAYEKWSRTALKFSADFQEHRSNLKRSTYHRLRPLLKSGLVLFDTIRHDFREVHNKTGGSAGHLKILEEAKKGKEFSFPFAPHLGTAPYRLTKGALYPIFAAFRNVVEIDPKTRDARWIDGPEGVLQLWDESKVELVAETFSATKDIGHLPDQLGKSRGHWANLHKTVEVRLLRKENTRLSGRDK